MNIPGLNDVVWRDLVTGKNQIEPFFLAAKFLLARARIDLGRNRDEATIARLAGELYHLYEKNQNLPNPRKDIEVIASL